MIKKLFLKPIQACALLAVLLGSSQTYGSQKIEPLDEQKAPPVAHTNLPPQDRDFQEFKSSMSKTENAFKLHLLADIIGLGLLHLQATDMDPVYLNNAQLILKASASLYLLNRVKSGISAWRSGLPVGDRESKNNAIIVLLSALSHIYLDRFFASTSQDSQYTTPSELMRKVTSDLFIMRSAMSWLKAGKLGDSVRASLSRDLGTILVVSALSHNFIDLYFQGAILDELMPLKAMMFTFIHSALMVYAFSSYGNLINKPGN